MENKDIIDEIIFTGKVLYKEGLVNSHAGNISVRDGDYIYITKTGKMLGFLDRDDIVKVPVFEESVYDKIASSELIVHRAIYKNSDYKAIIHAHPVYATALTFFLEEKFSPIDNEGKLFINDVPIIDVINASGSEELANRLVKELKKSKKNIFLIKKHGSFVFSNSLNYALKLTSDLEFCGKIYYLVKFKDL
ncbi:MAG: aldolase [Persephonella sp.]|nr:MAG: aldolase [Persephonella sp.]RUM61317.1 MAG: aldolase [Persephonella sp.]